MPVTDIAREKAVSIESGESLTAVVETMRSEGVGSVVVVENGSPVGLVADRDLALAVLGGEIDPDETTVDELLTEEAITIEADQGVYDAIELMSNRGVRRVIVVEDGELAGIISLSDVIVLLGMELQQVANTIRAVSPAYERLATEVYD